MEKSTAAPALANKSTFRYSGRDYLRRYGSWAVTVANVAGFFVVWQLITGAGFVNPLFLPTVTDMAAAVGDGVVSGVLVDATLFSLANFLAGMAAAIVVGVPLGMAMGSSRIAYAIFSPYMWALQSLPMISILPLLILILGFGVRTEFTLIFISAVFPIMINCLSGVQTVETPLVNAARVFGANRIEVYRHVIMPYTLPFILSGINQGMTKGLVGMIVAEIFGGQNGLGFVLQRAADSFNTPLLYGILLILVVIALLFVRGARTLEERLAPWRHTDSLS